MADIFDTLHRACIVMRDVDKAAAYCEAIGIGPWQDHPPLVAYM